MKKEWLRDITYLPKTELAVKSKQSDSKAKILETKCDCWPNLATVSQVLFFKNIYLRKLKSTDNQQYNTSKMPGTGNSYIWELRCPVFWKVIRRKFKTI